MSQTALAQAVASKLRQKNRGIPPPATFDFDALPGSANLTVRETCAVLRRTPGALELWRRDPNHPLRWRRIDGKPLYRVDAVREYIALREAQGKQGHRSQPPV